MRVACAVPARCTPRSGPGVYSTSAEHSTVGRSYAVHRQSTPVQPGEITSCTGRGVRPSPFSQHGSVGTGTLQHTSRRRKAPSGSPYSSPPAPPGRGTWCPNTRCLLYCSRRLACNHRNSMGTQRGTCTSTYRGVGTLHMHEKLKARLTTQRRT
jgi:hypothetical protein